MRFSVRRIRYTIILFLGVMGLVISIMPKTPSAASSKQEAQSKSSSPVKDARKALDKARIEEQANPSEKAIRATTEALKAYKSAVNARLAQINKRLAELSDALKQGGNPNEIESESAALKGEFKELRNSLTEYYHSQPRTMGGKLPTPIRLGALTQVCNTAPITINATGTASPYPSTIPVSGLTGTITNVTVTLNNFGHTFPDDVDILLVGPFGQNAIIFSDVGGGTPVSGVTITLDDAAATSLTTAPLVSGTFKPTNLEVGDIFQPPAPLPSGGSALNVFNGTDPNGTWSLYVRDDAPGDSGTIAGGWCLDITTQDGPPCVLTCPGDVTQPNDSGQCGAVVNYPAPTTTGTCGTVTCSPPSGSFFPIGTTPVNCSSTTGATCSFNVIVTGTCNTSNPCNPLPITINTTGPATPYPSNITVAGLTGVISHVTVTLNNFGHTFPDDVDILLVGPFGQNAIIFSDVGGGTPVSGVTITLDDAAAMSLTSAPLVSGTFKPTDLEGLPEIFPPPAPVPSGGSALNVFNGTNPNGVWSLYVKDDAAGDSGTIAGGWCLNIMTVDVVPCELMCPPDQTQPNTAGQCGAVVNYPAPTTTGTCGTVTCSPPSGSFFPIGTTPVNCSSTTGATCSFNVIVTGTCPGGCNPTSITINSAGAATPYPSSLAISGLTGVVSHVTVTLNNFSHTFPEDVDILLVGPFGQNAIILSDVGGGTAVSNITLTLDDAAATSLTTAPLVSGTFKPTNLEPGAEVFPPPAPVPSGGSALSVFNGTDPNGVWTLYVVDDSGGDAGAIAGGWCLSVTTVQPCVLTCPANQTVSNDPDQCGAVVNYPAPTFTGGCGTINCSPASGSFFPVGTTTVTCTPQSGPNCSFTVTVNDTQPPSITCPANVTQANDPNQCGAVVNYPAPTASDNCPGVGTPTCNHASGSFFPVGTTTVTCTVTDAHSNSASCSFTVKVNDTQPPTVSCPANITVPATTGQCGAVVNFTVTASDNCPGVTVAASPSSGSFFPKGTTTVMATATDASGNTATCSFTVTVNDTQPPTITCPPNQSVSIPAGQPCGTVNYPAPTASDNCPGVAVVCNPPSGSCFPNGTTTVTCTATDTSGNMASCSFTVSTFDYCLQDDNNPANVLKFSSTTGNYIFCCGGTVFTGTGTVTFASNQVRLDDNSATRLMNAKVQTNTRKGEASLSQPPSVFRCSIKDSNIDNNSCVCP